MIPFILIFSVIYAILPYLTFYNILMVSFFLSWFLMIWTTITDRVLILFIGLKKKFIGISRFGGKYFSYYKICPKCGQQYEIRDETVIIRDRLVIGYKCPFCNETVYL